MLTFIQNKSALHSSLGIYRPVRVTRHLLMRASSRLWAWVAPRECKLRHLPLAYEVQKNDENIF